MNDMNNTITKAATCLVSKSSVSSPAATETTIRHNDSVNLYRAVSGSRSRVDTMNELRGEQQSIRDYINTHELCKSNVALAEKRITALGIRLGEQAEKDAGFTIDSYREHLQQLEQSSIPDVEKISRHRNQAMESLNLAYANIIKEMRPVGGVLDNHELSDNELLNKMNRTIGSFYPSDWIAASNNIGNLAIRKVDGRSHYHSEDTDNVYNKDGWYAKSRIVGLPDSAVQEYLAKMSEDGDIVKLADAAPFVCDGMMLRIIVHPERVPFSLEHDLADKNGEPLGDGWRLGHVLTQTGDVSVEKQWYRYEYRRPNDINKNPNIPSINIFRDSHPAAMSQAMYHEFCHRAEAVVNGGIIMLLEEAFLIRRTTNEHGEREELRPIRDDHGWSIDATEFGRKGTFMDHYIGKQYMTSPMREVLSTGAEGLFTDRFGVFRGLMGNPEDLDHRGFTLGVFATV